MKKDLIPRLAFGLALAFLTYLGGFVTSHFRLFPHAFLAQALDQGAQVGEQAAGLPHHIHPARHDFAGVRRSEGAEVLDGAVLVTSYWPGDEWVAGLRLIGPDGTELHAWDADPRRIWDESPHDDALRGLFHSATNYVHGSHLFEDGDVIFSMEYLGLVRMDAAGEVVWRLDRRTHHGVSRNERGNFWVPSARWIGDPAEVARRFPGLVPPVVEDIALEVSPDGEVVREFSVLDVVFAHPELRRTIWTVGVRGSDVLHLNDIEELPTAMASAYPSLAAGDLVLSTCQNDLVFVVSPDSMEVKWWRCGPFNGQHDPDFLGDGTIGVFDNNDDGSLDGGFLGGSRMLQFGIEDGAMAVLYPCGAEGERRFYTQAGGKAQRLPDGHWLVTEARAGRVFEVDQGGRTVWEWCHRRHDDDGQICEVLEGTWYPLSAEDVARWTVE